MIKGLVDTNVLLDMMVEGRPGSEAAASFNRMLSGDDELAMCVGSLKDVHYIACHELLKYPSPAVGRA